MIHRVFLGVLLLLLLLSAAPYPAAQAAQGEIEYWITLAGDCTLGGQAEKQGSSRSFASVVGEDYAYPLEQVRALFEADDFTLVNLEGPLTTGGAAREKQFAFRGAPAYARVLSLGGVDAVSLANNHAMDYGQEGFADTLQALEAEGVFYATPEDSLLVTLEGGLRLGVYAAKWPSVRRARAGVEALRQEGAEMVLAFIHWGDEGERAPDGEQKAVARAAIEAGADLVAGHHPHVLQPISSYQGKPIFYSLGNFVFGGNRNPKDKDTAVIQQQVLRAADGGVRLGETRVLPFRLSGKRDVNDYQPRPASGADARRILKKLGYNPSARERK